MPSTSSPSPSSPPPHSWIHRSFLSNPCKLKCRERYLPSRSDVISKFQHSFSLDQNQNVVLLLPDPFTLRLYLPVFEELVPYFSILIKDEMYDSDLGIIDRNARCCYNLVIMESLAEFYMDAPPSMQCNRELNSHERKRILAMFQKYPREVIPMPYFDDEEDKSSMVLDYPSMSVQERCCLGIRRTAECFVETGFNVKVLITNCSELANTTDEAYGSIFSSLLTDVGHISLYMNSLIDDMREAGALTNEKSKHLLCLIERCNTDFAGLLEKLQMKEASLSTTGRVNFSESEIETGLQNGTLLRGTLEVTKQNIREAYITPTMKSRSKIFIQNPMEARAVHGDEVVVHILPQKQWKFPLGRRKLVHTFNDDENIEDTNPDSSSLDCLAMITGVIVCVLNESRRKKNAYVATIIDDVEYSLEHGIEYILAVPMDVRIPKIRLHTRQLTNIAYNRLLVDIDRWDLDSMYPSGHLKKIIGPVNSKEVEIECMLLESGIEFSDFSLSALSCVPDYNTVPTSDFINRNDLRDTPIFSVDPIGCQDIDDSFHIRRLGNGVVEVGVHIADVSYFLMKDSSLDREAANKATTFYLADRRFDMLPLPLMHLCSLHDKVERFAFSVIFHLDENDLTNVRSISFGKSVIRNCAALTYEQADAILQGTSPNDIATKENLCAGGHVDVDLIPILKNQLMLLTDLGRQRKAGRENLGALELHSVELKFKLDENGNPVKVLEKKELEIHNTVAELMIMANEYVAKQIYERYPTTALLRIHSEVSGDKFEELETYYRATGLTPSLGSNKDVANSLNRAKKQGNLATQSLLLSLTTKAMNEASYVCTGTLHKFKLSHYGLGLQFYTHFTSPIRRYSDIAVHRLLLASISNDQRASPYGIDELGNLCTRLNFQNRTAKSCSISCQKLFLSLYFQSNTETSQAIIVGLRDNGFLVYIPKFDIKGPVYLTDRNGCIQIDPNLFELSCKDGLPATLAFKTNPNCRRFTNGTCILHGSSDDEASNYLELIIDGARKNCIFRMLDTIQVQISCDSKSRARVPQIMLQLVHERSQIHTLKPNDSSKILSIPLLTNESKKKSEEAFGDIGALHKPQKSMYDVLTSIEMCPKLPINTTRIDTKSIKSGRDKICPGRFQFRNFRTIEEKIEDTFSTPTSKLSTLASITDYGTQRKIERATTSRMQRLASEKRHSRRAKSGK